MYHFSFICGCSVDSVEPSILLGRWQTDSHRKNRTLAPCEMVDVRLMMVSFIHKEILDHWLIKSHLAKQHGGDLLRSF